MTRVKLLVVDDPELLLVLQPTFVRRAGVRVLTGRDADETHAKALELRPDVVVLDGESWGDPCCRRIKLDRQLGGTPVVVLGRAAAAADAWVGRPLDRDDLVAAIRRFVAVLERASPRRRASLEVTYFDGEEEHRASTKDVSDDGLFLRCALPPAAGRELRLVLRGPDGSGRPVSARARVVRSVSLERDSHLVPGAALRLVALSARDRAALARLTAAGA